MQYLFPFTSCNRLFLHMERVTEELKVYLNASCEGALCVQLKGYDTILDHLKNYVTRPGVKVWIGTEYTNYALYEVITPQVCRPFISFYVLHSIIMPTVIVFYLFIFLCLTICLHCCSHWKSCCKL